MLPKFNADLKTQLGSLNRSQINSNKAMSSILEELIRDNRPYMETLKHPFFYEYLYLFNLEKEMEEIIEKINLP